MLKQRLTAIIMLGLGAWFLKLTLLGELVYYILPRFNVLVVGTAICLLVGGVLLLFQRFALHEISCHLPRSALVMMLVPLFIGFGMPAAPLSAVTVGQRGVETDLSSIRLTGTVDFQIDSSQRSFGDWVKIIGHSTHPAQHEGETAAVEGFVYREEGMAADEFYLARFLIRCCNADARPVVLRVRSDQASQWQADQWLAITGTFAIDDNPDQPLYIQLESAEMIAVPDTPYIY